MTAAKDADRAPAVDRRKPENARLRELVDAFQGRIEEAVITANVVSQELGSMQRDLQALIRERGNDQDVDTLVDALNDATQVVASCTGTLEVEIDRFLRTTRGEPIESEGANPPVDINEAQKTG